jgi:tRNA-Thr(GGU) m(6)t(6)A37 methyltransferase TsaA
MNITLKPIGYVTNSRKTPTDDYWGNVISTIEFDTQIIDASATEGLEDFSHVEVIFYMHQVNADKIVHGARSPRNNPDWGRYGILAQRAKNRPNQIGASFAKIIQSDAQRLVLQGLDAIDTTPILDIKPCLQECLPQQKIRQPAWTHELMARYYDHEDHDAS